MADPRVGIVLGTRPEIIKFAPLIRECEDRNVEFTIINTGQHYSETLSDVFFDQLELPAAEHNLGIGSASHGEQVGRMITEIERVLLDEDPEVVLVQGDTNSALAGALAADKLDVRLGHVEAGLRSFDRSMPEESNRRVADHLADYLFAPTATSRRLLSREGIPDERIAVTGNTIVDAIQRYSEFGTGTGAITSELDLDETDFAVLTAHRPANVDDPEQFADLLRGVGRFGATADLPVVYPIHPRAKKTVESSDVEVPESIRLVEPLDYLHFLELQRTAEVVFTDSGGVQEETCTLGVPCVTLRENTERPETVEVGANSLVGTDPDDIAETGTRMLAAGTDWANPFGDGDAAQQILENLDWDDQLTLAR